MYRQTALGCLHTGRSKHPATGPVSQWNTSARVPLSSCNRLYVPAGYWVPRTRSLKHSKQTVCDQLLQTASHGHSKPQQFCQPPTDCSQVLITLVSLKSATTRLCIQPGYRHDSPALTQVAQTETATGYQPPAGSRLPHGSAQSTAAGYVPTGLWMPHTGPAQ
jgi:hypothetical protein